MIYGPNDEEQFIADQDRSRCYHPHLAHGDCPAGHRIHLDVDHYDQPRWVHCLIVDLVQCPHDLEDVTGAAMPGKHRVR